MKRRSLIALLSLVLVASASAQIHVKDVSGSFPSGLPSAANLAIVSDGTTGAIKPTVVTIAPTTGNMSGMADITATGTVKADKLYADSIANEAGTGMPDAPNGITFGSVSATVTSTGLAKVSGIANAAGSGAVSLIHGATAVANKDIGISGTGALKTGYIEASDGTAAMTIADSTGAISGVVSLEASGAIRSTAGNVRGATVTSDGALTVSGSGASITGGIDNNSGGITEAGAISGATNVTATGTVQGDLARFDRLANEAGTGSVSATYGVTLPTGAYIISGDKTTSATYLFRIYDDADSGFGQNTGVPMMARNGQFVYWNGASLYQAGVVSNAADLGTSAVPWNKIYTDDLYLQLTTPASEGKLHWEGAAGDASMAIVPVKADGTAPASAADAVALSVKLAASPASGESVEVMRIASDSVILQKATETVAQLYQRVQSYSDYGGTGSQAKHYLSNVAGSLGASIQSRSSAGTEATPYDSLSLFLPGSPALPSSVEALRVTSGQVLVGMAGTAAAPSISWAGDPNTGLYGGTDAIGFSTGGTLRGQFSTSGFFSNQNATIDHLGTGSEAEINFSGSASSTVAAKIEMSKADGTAGTPYDSISFKLSDMGAPASIEAMRITSATVLVPKKLNLAGSSPEAVTIAAGPAATFAVTKTVVELTGDSGAASITTITGGVEGDILIIVPVALGGGITLVDDGDTPTTNELALLNNCVFSVAGTQSITLLRGPTYWIELSRSLN